MDGSILRKLAATCGALVIHGVALAVFLGRVLLGAQSPERLDAHSTDRMRETSQRMILVATDASDLDAPPRNSPPAPPNIVFTPALKPMPAFVAEDPSSTYQKTRLAAGTYSWYFIPGSNTGSATARLQIDLTERDFYRKSEGDHVRDFQFGANRLRAAGQSAENSVRGDNFGSRQECERRTHSM